jgi:MarR family
MSLLNDLRDYEKRVSDRLAELRPLVAEYQELERLAERLGLDTAPAPGSRRAPSAKPARRASRATSSSGRRRGRPGRKPQRRDQVLGLVKERPGITVPDIAKQLQVEPTGLYRVVRQLEKEGAIKKTGMELTPVA